MNRTHFLSGTLAAAAFAPQAVRAQALLPVVTTMERAQEALILSGGGARGAYQAGVIEGLRRTANVRDGQALPGIGVVCGASIGSINAWFVATAQYTQLADLWHGVARQNVFQLKRRFAATANPHAFIITKIVQALALAQGLTKNVQGILDGDQVERWIRAHVDPAQPIVVPLVFTVTNLDRQRSELFYRLPFDPSAASQAAALARLRVAVGADVPVRLATDALLAPALLASTAIPVLFDPVVMPVAEGTQDRFIDGGIADNAPIDVGRALARGVYAVLVDPVTPAREPYANALEIGVGAVGTAESRIFEQSLRAAALETQGKRLLAGTALTSVQKTYYDAILDADLFEMRPASELDVGVVDFDRQEKIDAAYQTGIDDIAHGFKPFTLPALSRTPAG
jgi:predicted acylesterase/phospholipase RssA